jgi:2-oxoglutarate dehydrogenase E2 component (dihydrolipoamide succinyltransferase)
LPKDGATHELRVAAPGYIPVTLMFADVPPPREIRLEALPAVTQSAAAEPAAAEPAATDPGAATPPPSTQVAAPRAVPPKPHALVRNVSAPASRGRVEDEWNALAADAAPSPAIRLAPPPPIRPAPPAAHSEPRVQIIGDGAPSVRVIE